VNLILSLVLMGPMKHAGLALSLSCASAIQFILLVVALKRKAPEVSLYPVLGSGLRTCLASLIMGLFLYCVQGKWGVHYVAKGALYLFMDVGVLVAAGAILYFGIAWLMGAQEVGLLVAAIGARRGRGAQKGEN